MIGTPLGINTCKNIKPCKKNPKRKKVKLKLNAKITGIINWLVNVKLNGAKR
jgi:ArsR family metal-binding transcriptional regulator